MSKDQQHCLYFKIPIDRCKCFLFGQTNCSFNKQGPLQQRREAGSFVDHQQYFSIKRNTKCLIGWVILMPNMVSHY